MGTSHRDANNTPVMHIPIHTHTHTSTEREREREINRDKQREIEREGEREGDTESDRERERERGGFLDFAKTGNPSISRCFQGDPLLFLAYLCFPLNHLDMRMHASDLHQSSPPKTNGNCEAVRVSVQM